MREFSYRRRLAHSVHARKQYHQRIFVLFDVVIDVVDEYLFQNVLCVFGSLYLLLENPVFQFLYNRFGGSYADVARKQRLFERLIELLVKRPRRKSVKKFFRNAVLGLFYGVRVTHCGLAVGDDDELRFRREFFEKLGKEVGIRVVERRLYLVQHAERHGFEFEYGKKYRDCGQSLFAAAEQGQVLQLLSGGLREYIDACFQRVVGFPGVQPEVAFAAVEKLDEHFAEIRLYALERGHKLGPHLLGELGDDFHYVVVSRLDVVALGDLLLPALFGVGKVLHGKRVDLA